MHFRDLRQGDVVCGSTRLGHPLRRTIDGKGTPYRHQITRPTKAQSSDIVAFIAWVVRIEADYLHLETQELKQGLTTYYPLGERLPCVVHYTGLKRLRLLSPFSVEATVAYRFVTDVRLYD